ncbi:MAG TPA: hypothetical protein PKH83_03145 [Cyclobacteriaceae bacterium]|nr:hypothetical protein [Cyclobacteriaceae bacterium]HNU41461.1 hypothetical protein [Cyclobacteriaceae bacterium]
MRKQRVLWYTNPSLKVVAIFSIGWLIGNGLLVIATTDLFAIPFFPNVSVIILALMILSTIQTAKLIRNYFRTRTTIDQ